MSLLRDMKLMSRDKSVHLTGVSSCRATLFERLRHNLLSLRQVSNIWRHKPDLLLFRSIAGDWWSIKQTCSRYIIKLFFQRYCPILSDTFMSPFWKQLCSTSTIGAYLIRISCKMGKRKKTQAAQINNLVCLLCNNERQFYIDYVIVVCKVSWNRFVLGNGFT